MNRIASTLATAALVVTAAIPAHAQELAPGIWTGTMTPPGGQPLTVTYEVGQRDGALAVAMRSFLVQEIIRFNDVRLAGDQLTFWWEPGIRVDCALQRTPSGSFEGDCRGTGGPDGAGRLTMVPPA